ncbi:MAG: FAD-dependent oxidoreductase [Planctomycetota bacterium]
MSEYVLAERAIPLDESWDVIVVGGGPAGCTAAAAAAREGAKTLLVEATECLGGMGTAGLVPAWCPFSDKEQVIYRGLAERVFRETVAGMPHIDPDRVDWVAIDPERLKRVYDDMVLGADATILFHTALCAVETDGGGVDAVVVSNKAGLSALRADVYVDCTGDGDLAAWAGAEYEQGDESGELQPATHCFILSNVDSFAYEHGHRPRGNRDPGSAIAEIVASDDFPLVKDNHLCNSLIGPGTVGFNAGHLWNVDNTDPRSVSKALPDGRKLAKQLRDGLARTVPQAFGDAFLTATGSLIGIRETRRIVGDYVLTFDDYQARRSFPDEICRNSYYIDVHRSVQETERELQGDLDMAERCAHYEPGESHGIPYRCLTPKGLANVLVAGRAISCDRPVQGSVRVMPVCLAMGEAAGIAAKMAAEAEANDVHAVDTEALRARIREEGGYLP